MGLITTLLPAIGAGVGYYFLAKKTSKVEGLLIGFIGGTVVQALVTQYPGMGLFRASLPLQSHGAAGPLVVTGRQSSGAYIF